MKNAPHNAPSNAAPTHNQHPPKGQDRPSMLTLPDLCRRFQISPRQIYRCINRGELPAACHRLGRKSAWPTSVIEQIEASWADADLAELKRRQQADKRPL